MKTVFFGLGNKYDDGITPAVAINSHNQVIEIHNSGTNELWYHVGQSSQGVVNWQPSVDFKGGTTPAVAINDAGYVVEVHQTDNISSSDLYWNVLRVQNDTVTSLKETQYASGDYPCVAINNQNLVVAAYNNDSTTIRCRFGTLNTSSNTISWISSEDFNGKKPSISINNNGLAFLVYEDYNSSKMKYRTATFNSSSINWSGSSHTIGTDDPDGDTPVVAITDEGLVFVNFFQMNSGFSCLLNLSGQVTDAVSWQDATFFDYGANPKIATNGVTAIQVHQSENMLNDLYYTNCMVLDRKQWMGNLYTQIKDKTVGQIVMPATHDSGMSEGGFSFSTLGKTQDRNILGQLEGGIRYFDLRPEFDDNDYYTYHNFSDVKGESIDDVLNDVYTFMSEKQQKELVILKFSHWGNFDGSGVYSNFANKITTKLKNYLFTLPANTKFGSLTFESMIGGGGKVLVICDNNYAISYPQTGIYVYRDGVLNCDNET
jgi:hypothetical protein